MTKPLEMTRLSYCEASSLLAYEPDTGIIRWRVDNKYSRVKAGDVAGYQAHSRYRVVRINRHQFFQHRLAWLLKTGGWPAADIDHVDRDRGNNIFSNLREATRSQNLGNTIRPAQASPLPKGVSVNRQGKFTARVCARYLGLFDTPEAAHHAYLAAAREIFGPFARAA